ncbi:hypothetical protein TVAG_421550 [Trichomonas vaginalis G3]|uniref:Peptidase C1A papain C-terminal domain-containing protein n=1 Tax=Trichomonas vaginalis (strain ATCC PRA-98 / G3) TaxID=412133 RepID=A2FR42_TRIV3|nr:cysteine proteinases family [Trichomonas vaginalis G3]EAX92631.1 hypothetical protein TVAG_421550 [Trichomonas vaginalis G3]KAI5540093.1 cysteine proteinases family [Trichomonas vaginalis G3]|eukprot:XP_001305561.1 hypothetical protein [Trichomonas vaginalis G3]
MVDKINSNSNSSFKAHLYPKFAKMTIKDAKRFLTPVRSPPKKQGSAIPVGADETRYKGNKNFIFAGIWQQDLSTTDEKTYNVPIYDVTNLCSSWAPSVTSAMSVSVGRWANRFMNFSLQFVLDCDILGDACIERSALNAYSLFWKTKIPEASRWDDPNSNTSPRKSNLQAPVSSLTSEICLNPTGCYPGTTGCSRSYALTGSCDPSDDENKCPIYFLYNWRWIKSHLFEVGPVTSSVLVQSQFFSYDGGVYSSADATGEILGMLDVTIYGWGQEDTSVDPTATKKRWWWISPHLGCDFGIAYDDISSSDSAYTISNVAARHVNGGTNCAKGFMKFNRRFDDSLIESFAIGPTPYNFIPGEWLVQQQAQ